MIIRNSNKKLITIKLVDKNIKIIISYTPNTRLKKRLKLVEELKKELFK
jgi:hypothetical protein